MECIACRLKFCVTCPLIMPLVLVRTFTSPFHLHFGQSLFVFVAQSITIDPSQKVDYQREALGYCCCYGVKAIIKITKTLHIVKISNFVSIRLTCNNFIKLYSTFEIKRRY